MDKQTVLPLDLAPALRVFASPELELIFHTPQLIGKRSGWWGHVPFAFWIMAACEPRLFVELGTHNGVSYAAFCEAVARKRLATRCFAVDTWQGDEHAGIYGEQVYGELRLFHDRNYRAFSELMRCTFDDAQTHFADGSIDLLHIDGFHTYEAVKHDFETWLPKLSDRAVVLFHDINVHERDFGVYKLFAELRSRYASFEFLHGHGLGVVLVGAQAPAPVQALCAITDPTTIHAIRERFAYLGDRWVLAMQERLTAESVGQQAAAAADAREAQIEARLREEIGAQHSASSRAADDVSALVSAKDRALAEANAQIETHQRAAQNASAERAALIAEQARAAQNASAERAALIAEQARAAQNASAERAALIAEQARATQKAAAEREILVQGLERASRTSADLADLKAHFADLAQQYAAIFEDPAFGTKARVRRRLRRIVARLRMGAVRPNDLRAAEILRRSIFFDRNWYLKTNADVASSGLDPVVHYLKFGAVEGRQPSPWFSGTDYLERNQDLGAHVNPLLHYIECGRNEGRKGGVLNDRLDLDSLLHGEREVGVHGGREIDDVNFDDLLQRARAALEAPVPDVRIAMPRLARPSKKADVARPHDYAAWCEMRLNERRSQFSVRRHQAWNHLITVVAYGEKAESDEGLSRTLSSLRGQTYRNVEILVAGPCNADADDYMSLRGLFVEPALEPLQLLSNPADDRLWRGSHLVFAPAGTTFDPDAFALLNEALSGARGKSSPDLVICDHDRRSEQGSLREPCFAPGWDPDLIAELDYVGTAFMASRKLILEQRADGRPDTLHGWLRGVAAAPAPITVAHLVEPIMHLPVGLPQLIESHPVFANGGNLPSVAIVIPNRDRPELLERCVRFLEHFEGPAPELVIVDHSSTDLRTLALYDQLQARYGAVIRRVSGRFNFSRMVNIGVAASSAEAIVLLNNDVEITVPGQLEMMIRHAVRPEVGVVGAHLLYPDGTVQHAGMLLEPGPNRRQPVIPRHVLRGAPQTSEGYLHALRTVRNYQVVTGALLVTRRAVFERAGGCDEVSLPVEYNDVDYCLCARAMGLRVIAVPTQGIYHNESSTRGTEDTPEVIQLRAANSAMMASRWGDTLIHDPFRNPWAEIGDVPQVRFPWTETENNR
ncbi:class I SAM-dependent methyltransferase [Paraburkholderia flagellata]|uniref:class I SAM-dependent methyltransferase n=1 Tax=Paraburkholderia flagellata TaxID=2883241 RepID=UPI001F27B2D9|nr:class I SAM-dependent methyltransferase [Paraburkholderia flagellata]